MFSILYANHTNTKVAITPRTSNQSKIMNNCQLLSGTSLSTTLGYNYTYVSIDNKLQSTHLIKVGSFFNQW